ncbi:hypothetical protein, partial [Sulfurirhabdus autotrophica]
SLRRIDSGHLAGALALGVVVVAGQQAAFAGGGKLSGLVVGIGTASAIGGNVTSRVKGHGCTEPGSHAVGAGAVGVAAFAITHAVAVSIIFKGLSISPLNGLCLQTVQGIIAVGGSTLRVAALGDVAVVVQLQAGGFSLGTKMTE